jgi:ribosomal protein S18 acetylase RimI-like enzyme
MENMLKIVNVYTKPEYRGKGYQQKLFKHCMEFLEKEGIRFVELKTLNEVAKHIYKKFGFIDDDIALKYYFKGSPPNKS